jgi:hypothetical protein
MITALFAALFAAAFAVDVVAYLIIRGLQHALEELSGQAEADAQEIAELRERLIYAAREGYIVPPPQEDLQSQEVEPLPPSLSRVVEEYEDPRSRERWSYFFRQELAKGLEPDAILLSLERDEPA